MKSPDAGASQTQDAGGGSSAIARRLRSPWTLVAFFALLEIVVLATGIEPWRVSRNMAAGRKLAAEGRSEEALKHYAYLREKFPESATINLEMGFIYLRLKRWEEAADCFKIVSLMRVPPRELNVAMGRAFVGMGEKQLALTRFKLAYKENPKDPVACYYVAEWMYEDAKTRNELLDTARVFERAAFDPSLGFLAQKRLAEIETRLLELNKQK
jgi:tetratricopeptide (TPR) repeat protein